MIQYTQLTEAQILIFGLVLMRMLGFVFSAAVFNSSAVSTPLKILFSLVLTLCVYNVMATNEALVRVHENENQLILLAGREVIIGVLLGFVTRLFFFAISMAGEITSISMGLGQAQIYNPMMGSMANAMEQFYSILATLVFLALNGHHYIIQGVVQSFSSSPVADLSFHYQSLAEFVARVQSFLLIGIKISAPVLISTLIVQFAMALLSRVVPQINMMVTSATVTMLAGLVILFVSLPLLVMQMSGLADFSMNEFFKFIKAI